jgi:hypothetical protein
MVQIFDIPVMDETYQPTHKDFRFDKALWRQIRPLLKEALLEVLLAGRSKGFFILLGMWKLRKEARPYLWIFLQEEFKVKVPAEIIPFKARG